MQPGKALALALAGRFDPLAHGLGRFARRAVAELLVIHPRHLDVDVDAVQQRAGDALLVLGDHGRGAGAGL